MDFGLDFWLGELRGKGYGVVEERLDIDTLVKQGVVPADCTPKPGTPDPNSLHMCRWSNGYRPFFRCSGILFKVGEAALHHLRPTLRRTLD